MVVCQTQGHTVVEHHAVGSAHNPVTGFADLELEVAVGVDPVDELRGVLALDFDLAERCGVQEAHGFAHSPAFAGDCCVHVLPVLRVVPRALPLADVFEHRTVGHVPRVDVRLPGRVIECADAAPGKCRKRHRGVGGSEGCCADLSGGDSPVFSRGAAHHGVDRLLTGLAGCQGADFSTSECFCDEADGVDPADLPLVHASGNRGVALDVFNRQHARTGGADDVADGVVTLEIDEVFGQGGQLFGLRAQLLFFVPAGNEPQLVSLAGLRHARGCRF